MWIHVDATDDQNKKELAMILESIMALVGFQFFFIIIVMGVIITCHFTMIDETTYPSLPCYVEGWGEVVIDSSGNVSVSVEGG